MASASIAASTAFFAAAISAGVTAGGAGRFELLCGAEGIASAPTETRACVLVTFA